MSREQIVRDALLDPRISRMLDDIIRKEGGFNDIKEDRGGATNFGISLRYARGLGLRLDNDGDGDVDADDIRLVTEQQARVLYVEDFFLTPRLHLLPWGLQAFHFDFAVNSGTGRAIIELQDTLNALREDSVILDSNAPLIADGRIGPRTLAAVNSAVQALGLDGFMHRLVDNRIAYVRGIVHRDPSQSKFLRGWINRIESFRPKR